MNKDELEEVNKGPFVNPLTGLKNIDEVITEKEAKKRGYFELQHLLRYLEDDNEFVKYFIIEGKHILVDLEKPYLQYKKHTQINHERIIQTPQEDDKLPVAITGNTCTIEDEGCISCSG